MQVAQVHAMDDYAEELMEYRGMNASVAVLRDAWEGAVTEVILDSNINSYQALVAIQQYEMRVLQHGHWRCQLGGKVAASTKYK